MKKNALVIGGGRLGIQLCLQMQEVGIHVLLVDKDEDKCQELIDEIPLTVIGDCTNKSALNSLGIKDFDVCFVTISDNFEACITITVLLKELGAKYISVKSATDLQTTVLKKIGANQIIDTEFETAQKLILHSQSNYIFENYFNLSETYAIVELKVPRNWIGKTLLDLKIRSRFGLNVIAIKNKNNVNMLLDACYTFDKEDFVLVCGKKSVISNYIKNESKYV